MDFNQADEKFRHLKTRFEAGELTEAEFKTRLQDLMVQDEQGDWWMIGYETEKWYRHDGTNWVQTDPPGRPPQKVIPVAHPELSQPMETRAVTPGLTASKTAIASSASTSQGLRTSLIFIALAALIIVFLGGYYLLRGTGQASTPSPIPPTVVTSTRTSTNTPSPTKTATATSTPVPEYHVTIAISKAGLYRGPGLGYGVADQKMFPRGDVFTVISRDSSGYWFFSKSTDGLEGWLYLEWINSDFDLLAIPTIAYVPPPPPTATRKPKACPAPPGCNVWDPVACVCLG